MVVNEWRLNKTYFVYMNVLLTLLNENFFLLNTSLVFKSSLNQSKYQ